MRIRGMAFMIIGTCRLLGGHHRAGRVEHAVGEAPFVVVPSGDLHETVAGDLRQRGVEDRAVVVAVEVRGDEKLVVVAEDAGEVFGLGGGLHEGVDFLNARVALGDEGEVDEADVDRRDADGEAVEQEKQAEAEAQRAAAEARRAEWEARIAEAKAAAAENSYYEYRSADANPYESVLADDYESAYARRLRGFESPTYKMPSSYINARYGSAFNYVSAYDPAFYNIVVMGDQVWVEPKYITSMFGSWGTVIYSDPWYYGWNRPWGPSFSFGSWGLELRVELVAQSLVRTRLGTVVQFVVRPLVRTGLGLGARMARASSWSRMGAGLARTALSVEHRAPAQSLHVAFGNPLRRGIVFRFEIDRVDARRQQRRPEHLRRARQQRRAELVRRTL